MYYPYSREDKEIAIEQLASQHQKCFFVDPEKRRPLKKNIIADLTKVGAPLASELMIAAISWYESHFNYQYGIQTGVKRVGLNGEEGGTVTELEQRNAMKYVRERKREEREKQRIEKFDAAVKPTKINLPPSITKEIVMPPKVTKSSDPLAPIQDLFNAVRGAFEQPEALRRPMAIAGLKVVAAEIEKVIATMEAAGTPAFDKGHPSE